MNTTISEAALPVVARYVGRTGNIYRYIAEDLAVVDAQIANEAKKPEAVRLRDELRERDSFERWATSEMAADCRMDSSGQYNSSNTQGQWLAWQAALAATGKQQVGEVQGARMPPLSADEVAAMAPAGLTWDETGAWAMGYEACRKAAIAAPPAQAVDLGQFRRPIEEWRADMKQWIENHGDAPGQFYRDIEEADRLLALIDGQAVQS